jgi:hypothetical protein
MVMMNDLISQIECYGFGREEDGVGKVKKDLKK